MTAIGIFFASFAPISYLLKAFYRKVHKGRGERTKSSEIVEMRRLIASRILVATFDICQ